MMKTIAGLFPSVDDAHAAANDLMANGFSSDSINIVARKGEDMNVESGDSLRSEERGKGAATGALAGGAIGGVAGLLAAAVGLTIPGVGPALAAGPIISALTGAGVGAAAGGIIGALTKMGVPEHEAHYYAEGVRRGGTLVSAQANDDRMATQAAEIMDAHNAMDIEGLAGDWRSQGWSRFEEGEPTESAMDIEHTADSTSRGRVKEGEATIPVTEEEIKLGKREASRGGGRVYSHVERTPVEDELTLREREEKTRDTMRPTEVDVERTGAQSGTRGRSRYTGPERRRAGAMAYTGPERRREPWPGPAPM